MTSQIKTVLLLALLSAIIIGLGGIMGGRTGIIIAFVIAMIMNVGSYWYSDKIVLSMYQARELSEDEAPMLHRMVAELSANAGIPKPRVCVIPEDAPNAFATGRDPEHGVVAVTDGIMRILSPEELRGVIAHEIGHIANRDILIQTIAGVLASVIVSIANFMQFAAIFGGSSNDEEGGTNPIAAFLLAILASAAGLFGLAAGCAGLIYHLASLETFGVPYLAPFTAGAGQPQGHPNLLRPPLPRMKWRDGARHTENRRNQR